MPYYGIEPETAAEYDLPEEELGGYESAQAMVDFATSSELVKFVQRALTEKGFQIARVRYDGGYDEGFSYFDFATVNGVRFAPAELVELFKNSPLEQSLRTSWDQPNLPARYRAEMEKAWQALPVEKRWAQALEDFALELANVILYEGFGTGEATIRGQFQADLQTGELVDLQDDEAV